MLPFSPQKVIPSTKLCTTHTPLPRHIDPTQPPTKRKPFSTLWAQRFLHTLDVIVPAELADVFVLTLEKRRSERRTAESKARAKAAGKGAVGDRARDLGYGDGGGDCGEKGEVRFAKVVMGLGDLVEAGFLDSCVKKGNVLMLSEGRHGVDEVYALSEGVLTIELDKPTYERAGLMGKAIPDGGRKHIKSRYLIEINLRQPSMLHGKKGFERIVWASKNVLTQSKTWLFYDCSEGTNVDTVAALEKHHPTHHTIRPSRLTLPSTLLPSFPPSSLSKTSAVSSYTTSSDYAADLHEYLSLLALSSPRVASGSNVDPYICRYNIPDWTDYCTPPASPAIDTAADGKAIINADSSSQQQIPATKAQDLTRLRWKGFLPASFAVEVSGALHTVLRPKKDKSARVARQQTSGNGMDVDRAPDVDVDMSEGADAANGADDVQTNAPTSIIHSEVSGRAGSTQQTASARNVAAQSRSGDVENWGMLQTHGFSDDHVTVLIPPGCAGSECVEWVWKGPVGFGF